MSSSSAFVVAMWLALADANDLSAHFASGEELAGYLGAVENGRPFGMTAGDRGVGTLGGSQDHTAILCCRAGMLSMFSFCPVRSEGSVPFPEDRCFVVAFSGVAAEKSAAARERYNALSRAAAEALSLYNNATGDECESLGSAASTSAARDRVRRVLDRAGRGDLRERFEAFVAETFDIIPPGVDALARCEYGTFGSLVATSQRNAETLLRNQIPETIELVHMARMLGADAASAFGAGFGGSVWALVAKAGAAGFADAWSTEYARRFALPAARAVFMVTTPGPGALTAPGVFGY
jgi:galactokinase